ncbi:uncharacterized protein [Nicotiana tomentosiformis]|uniref:uncharacterized protein n=1 Tax=Nicotiana tomentosiformis TaxID=4098 RepID=UPI00388C948E
MTGYQITETVLQEGYSTRRPPYFNSQDYNHWKERMKVYVQLMDYRAWIIIHNVPRPIPNNNDGNKLVKRASIFDYTKEQLDIKLTNARAINMLYCAISEEEYKKISMCETAKAIWKKLENIHGTPSKLRKLNPNQLLKNLKMENIELVLNDLEKVLNEYNKFRKEKKIWEIELEEYNKLIYEKKD